MKDARRTNFVEFNKWYKNIEQEYPMYQDKDGYNIGNIRALKVGWKAALEFVLSLKQAPESVAILVKQIEEELKEK